MSDEYRRSSKVTSHEIAVGILTAIGTAIALYAVFFVLIHAASTIYRLDKTVTRLEQNFAHCSCINDDQKGD